MASNRRWPPTVAPPSTTPDYAAALREAAEWEGEGRWQLAAAIYESVLQIEPHHHEARARRAPLFFHRRRRRRTLALLSAPPAGAPPPPRADNPRQQLRFWISNLEF